MEVTLELYEVFDILDGILNGDYPDVEDRQNKELVNLVYDAKTSLSRLYTFLHDMKNTRWSNVQSSENKNKENLDKIFNSKPIKSSTYQFVAEFDGHYQPRVIDYISKPGYPFWIDANEDYSNGKIFTEQELSKVAKQLERYYAETGGGASDIEIVRDNGDSVYLEEFLQEGSFDKAWEKAVAEEQDWYNK